jgi:hypothetical protein
MAKTVQQSFYGLPCIIRHDYEDVEIQQKLKVYQENSYKAFKHFLTNVPLFKYDTFLDVGCGDDFIVKKAKEDFNQSLGIDLYPGADYGTDVVIGDWYEMSEPDSIVVPRVNAMFINHSLEHAANVYALMEQVSKLQNKNDALFIAVPDGNSPFGYAITSSTTHFSCITEGYLRTTLQRFGYNVEVEKRELRAGAPELWAYAIKQYDGLPTQ